MDSITQAALGATLAGAIAGKKTNGKVLLMGAALGTLPDLDVLLDYGDAVSNTIKHRGFSHSLLLLPPFALLISWLYSRLKPDAFWRFPRVLFLTLSVLITHTLLDAMTTYGTQLLWPIHGYFSVSNIFIIDPIYTLPLLAATVVALLSKPRAARWCCGALLLSTLYLGWGFTAQQMIANRVEHSLAQNKLPNAQVLITPTPFNTLLWRVVVLSDGKYYEALASILDEESKVDFTARSLTPWPIEETPEILINLQDFSHHFVNYRVENDSLIVSDLRLGFAEDLFFEFIFAEKNRLGEWSLLDAPKRYEGEPNLAIFTMLWERLKGNRVTHTNR